MESQIEKIKCELGGLGDLRPGSLSEQHSACGNPNCRCKENPAKRHGPYDQISFTRKGGSRTKFVRRPHLTDVKKQLKNYAQLRSLVDSWVELSSELCQLRLEEKE
jgi:hypothetical protein